METPQPLLSPQEAAISLYLKPRESHRGNRIETPSTLLVGGLVTRTYSIAHCRPSLLVELLGFTHNASNLSPLPNFCQEFTQIQCFFFPGGGGEGQLPANSLNYCFWGVLGQPGWPGAAIPFFWVFCGAKKIPPPPGGPARRTPRPRAASQTLGCVVVLPLLSQGGSTINTIDLEREQF